jgi:hypothetical protein
MKAKYITTFLISQREKMKDFKKIELNIEEEIVTNSAMKKSFVFKQRKFRILYLMPVVERVKNSHIDQVFDKIYLQHLREFVNSGILAIISF